MTPVNWIEVTSQPAKQFHRCSVILATAFLLFAVGRVFARDPGAAENHAAYVPLISGGTGFLQTVNGGVTSLVPQITPVLLVPIGTHVLLESRAPFVGFFQRRNKTTGPFTGKVFKEVEYVQVDWLADTHLIATAGRYLLPFGLYNERLDPVWIRNLQTPPITALIGTRTSGSGDGFMLRGVALQKPSYSAQYTAYFSARSNVNLLEATRTAGEDASLYWRKPRLEVGSSYQRFLQDRRINSAAGYVSWQPPATPLDLKAEYDYSHNGYGYWLESAYLFRQLAIPSLLRRLQGVGRMQQFVPLNGGGNGVPQVNTKRFDAGLNYYFRDDLRLVSSYARSFSSQKTANIWIVGVTYRFMLPLWPERKH